MDIIYKVHYVTSSPYNGGAPGFNEDKKELDRLLALGWVVSDVKVVTLDTAKGHHDAFQTIYILMGKMAYKKTLMATETADQE